MATTPPNGNDLRRRSTEDVFEDHLRLALQGDTETDIARNFAEDVVLLTGIGVLCGHDGVRRSRDLLRDDVPDADYRYLTRLTSGEYAYLEWSAEAKDIRIEDGADSYHIEDGLIHLQTIHYTVHHRAGYHQPEPMHRHGPGTAP